jgi:hypothetical protein
MIRKLRIFCLFVLPLVSHAGPKKPPVNPTSDLADIQKICFPDSGNVSDHSKNSLFFLPQKQGQKNDPSSEKKFPVNSLQGMSKNLFSIVLSFLGVKSAFDVACVNHAFFNKVSAVKGNYIDFFKKNEKKMFFDEKAFSESQYYIPGFHLGVFSLYQKKDLFLPLLLALPVLLKIDPIYVHHNPSFFKFILKQPVQLIIPAALFSLKDDFLDRVVRCSVKLPVEDTLLSDILRKAPEHQIRLSFLSYFNYIPFGMSQQKYQDSICRQMIQMGKSRYLDEVSFCCSPDVSHQDRLDPFLYVLLQAFPENNCVKSFEYQGPFDKIESVYSFFHILSEKFPHLKRLCVKTMGIEAVDWLKERQKIEEISCLFKRFDCLEEIIVTSTMNSFFPYAMTGFLKPCVKTLRYLNMPSACPILPFKNSYWIDLLSDSSLQMIKYGMQEVRDTDPFFFDLAGSLLNQKNLQELDLHVSEKKTISFLIDRLIDMRYLKKLTLHVDLRRLIDFPDFFSVLEKMKELSNLVFKIPEQNQNIIQFVYQIPLNIRTIHFIVNIKNRSLVYEEIGEQKPQLLHKRDVKVICITKAF